MRKINLIDYNVDVPQEDGTVKALPYHVKDSLTGILFHPDLKLAAMGLMEHKKIADKIEAATNEILLEDAEFDKLKNSLDKIKGFGKADVELVNRILTSETIEVEEKSPEDPDNQPQKQPEVDNNG